MITPLESRILDANSESLGVSVDGLMANAGEALAEVIRDFYDGDSILFVCGTGNNGGDGFAASNILGADVAVFKEPKTEPAKKQFSMLKKKPLDYSKDLLEKYDVIVDCVLGTGVSGDLREPYASYVDDVNSSDKVVISCDVPTGIGSINSIVPDITVTFHDMKTCMDTDSCGTIIIADIGIPKEASETVGPGDMLRYPIPEKNAHKGQNGRLLIIGGGPYVGAPAMAGMAALRVGADLVHIVTPDSSYRQISSMCPTYIVHNIGGDVLTSDSVGDILELSADCDAILIGPGLGQDVKTKNALLSIIERTDKPMIIDADGISMLEGMMLRKNVLYTPHRREFQKLVGNKDIDVQTAASEMCCVIVLKGPEDLISDGKMIRKNLTGTPAMTVGGTGDVLAGTIAGLVSKGMSYFDAGCLGTYICGRAGELSFDEFSYGLLPTDIIDNIARVLKNELR